MDITSALECFTKKLQPGFPDSQSYDEAVQAARVSYTLQTTLDFEVLMRIFAQEVMRHVAYTGILYHHVELAISLTIGEMAEYHCIYQMEVAEEELGALTVARRTPFSLKEVKKLEELLEGLFYPLRNALSFRRAMTSATSDCLTGLGNRYAFEQALKRDIEIARRHATPLSLVVLDVDDFKRVNDKCGHKLGDEVLKSIADVLSDCVRSSDMVFRYGGEEFVVLLSHTDLEGARLLAERIRRSVENLCFRTKHKSIRVTMSIGITDLTAADGQDTLFKRADRALYKAKANGKNRVYSLRREPEPCFVT